MAKVKSPKNWNMAKQIQKLLLILGLLGNIFYNFWDFSQRIANNPKNMIKKIKNFTHILIFFGPVGSIFDWFSRFFANGLQITLEISYSKSINFTH